MSTEDLIQQLTHDLQPVRRLRPVAVRIAGWLVVAVASLGLGLSVMGIRRELGDAVDRTDFAIESVLLIVTALSAAVGALLVSVPGAERDQALAMAADRCWHRDRLVGARRAPDGVGDGRARRS